MLFRDLPGGSEVDPDSRRLALPSYFLGDGAPGTSAANVGAGGDDRREASAKSRSSERLRLPRDRENAGHRVEDKMLSGPLTSSFSEERGFSAFQIFALLTSGLAVGRAQPLSRNKEGRE